MKAANLMEAYVSENGYDDLESLIYWARGLVRDYGEAAAALACEMYDSIAAASGVAVPPAVPADVMPDAYIAQSVRKTVEKAPTTVPRVVERLVKQAGADTMLQNAQRDGAQFAWIPVGDTCAFCITLASRGWQHMSKKALKHGHAEHIHSNCDCNYTVRFDSSSGVDGYDPQKYADMYYGADGKTPAERINAIRRENYAENREKILEQKRLAYKSRSEREEQNNDNGIR